MKEKRELSEQINLRLSPEALAMIDEMRKGELRSRVDLVRLGLALYAEKFHPKLAGKFKEAILP